jgi:hypothetical protein
MGVKETFPRSLYKLAFDLMKIDRGTLILARYPLMSFSGEQVLPIGSIELQVIARTFPRSKTVMVRFLVVDRPSAHNAIFRRTSFNELKAVTSTPDLCTKFPTDEGVGVVKGDQKAARLC